MEAGRQQIVAGQQQMIFNAQQLELARIEALNALIASGTVDRTEAFAALVQTECEEYYKSYMDEK